MNKDKVQVGDLVTFNLVKRGIGLVMGVDHIVRGGPRPFRDGTSFTMVEVYWFQIGKAYEIEEFYVTKVNPK